MLRVLLVHGLIGPFAGKRVEASLGPASIIAPDLLGYGSEKATDPTKITVSAQVAYVQAAADNSFGELPFHVVGHSVGGVIAAAFTHQFPHRVLSLISVEGNFTLADAFMCRHFASMPVDEIARQLEIDGADPARWLREAKVAPNAERVQIAAEALAYQPATTIRAMAETIVTYTGCADYERLLEEVFAHTPTHLIAGARSRPAWDVPSWAVAAATSYTEIPDAGHMVAWEAPDAFGQALRRLLLHMEQGTDVHA